MTQKWGSPELHPSLCEYWLILLYQWILMVAIHCIATMVKKKKEKTTYFFWKLILYCTMQLNSSWIPSKWRLHWPQQTCLEKLCSEIQPKKSSWAICLQCKLTNSELRGKKRHSDTDINIPVNPFVWVLNFNHVQKMDLPVTIQLLY